MTEQDVSPGVWNRVVDRLWPLTFGVGILMTVVVFAFLAFSSWLVFGAALSIVTDNETWRWLHDY
jgi:hypothetical protein